MTFTEDGKVLLQIVKQDTMNNEWMNEYMVKKTKSRQILRDDGPKK